MIKRTGTEHPSREKWLAFLLLLLPFAFSLLSDDLFSNVNAQIEPQSGESPDATSLIPTPTTKLITDDATLNLHRWGAVTIFHGLPSDRVNAIAEDKKGLLWFGTDNGLVRYDGRNVEPMTGENSLRSRHILALKLDARGNLWIGTEIGAYRLIDDRIEFLSETQGRVVTGIAVAPQDEVALVTATGEIINYQMTDLRLSSDRYATKRLTSTKLDQQSHPLLKSPNGPDQILPLTAITRIPFNLSETGGAGWIIGSSGRGAMIQRGTELREAAIKLPRPYFVTSVYADSEKKVVWIGEQANKQKGGLWMLDDNALTRAALETGAVTTLSGGKGELWVGTYKQGAFLLKLEDRGAKQIGHLTFENTAGGLRSNQINSIFRDREGIVWFGTDRGVCRYDRDGFRASNVSENPQSNFVRSLLPTSSGVTFCGSNRGLFQLSRDPNDEDFGTWSEIAGLQGRAVYALSEDEAGAVWVGTSSGLFVKLKNSAGFTHASTASETTVTTPVETESEESSPLIPLPTPPDSSPETPAPQSRERVRALASFRGKLYAAIFEHGIERIEPGPNGTKRTMVLNDAAAQQAICFAVDGDQALWFGTGKGELLRYDGSRAIPVPLPYDQSKSTAEHAVRAIRIVGNRIWIGTSQGLYLREGDATREVPSNIDVREIDVRALLVQPDDSGHETVWCATQNAGLIKLRPHENISIRFDTEQGLASQQVFALAAENSEIWIGTNRGVIRHRPNPVEPHLQVHRLVADQIYSPEYLTAELSLPSTQQNFLLEVTGLSSRTYPSQFQYEFILKNRNGEELKRSQTHDPQFAVEGLKSGGYVIVARAISRDLTYSAPLTVRLRIQRAPFPWSTILLTSLLGVAVTAAIWAFRQQRRLARANRALEETNTELHETRLRLANETEAERSRIARDLHDQTLADLRHLLVLTDQLPSKDEDNSPSPALLRREIESVSNEIRHICEDLSPSVLENIGFLPALEWALSDVVAHLPPEQKFTYQFICEPELEDRLQLSHIEKIQLYRIVQEALNNICRHAKPKAVQMTVGTEKTCDLVIEIEDDGVGFDGQTTNKTGHGIANIRSRANLIGAQVWWSNANPGCQFKVRKGGVVLTEPSGSVAQ